MRGQRQFGAVVHGSGPVGLERAIFASKAQLLAQKISPNEVRISGIGARGRSHPDRLISVTDAKQFAKQLREAARHMEQGHNEFFDKGVPRIVKTSKICDPLGPPGKIIDAQYEYHLLGVRAMPDPNGRYPYSCDIVIYGPRGGFNQARYIAIRHPGELEHAAEMLDRVCK
jgi:hypothetical protein